MKGSWSPSVASASLSSGAWWGVLSVKISPLPHHCVPPTPPGEVKQAIRYYY